ncbi:MAG: hypothetical protein SFX18_09010 [Pirellulales bacterium]|nr:hypothetical protein [Pirellulales bacterium]
MTRLLCRGLLVGALLSSASIGFAAWPSGYSFFGDVKTSWHRNNYWPQPFAAADRQTVPQNLQVFANAGWERQCLLGDQHFDNNQKLSTTGQMKVRYILTQTPPQYRTVFVERNASEALTKTRVDAVQTAVAGMVTDGPLPEVVVSNMPSEGWSAEYVDAVNRKLYASMPVPRLPESTSGESDSGSGQ